MYPRPDEEGKALAYLGSIFFSLGLALFSVVMLSFRALVNSVKSRLATNWTMAPALITTGDVKAIHGRFIDYALGTIGYSYKIDDDYYSGYLTRQFWDEQRAWTFVDSSKGKSALVRYNAGNPRASWLPEVHGVGILPLAPGPSSRPVIPFSPALALLWALRNSSKWAERKLREQATTWPSAHGTVAYAEPRLVGEDAYVHWVGDLSYSYSVDGQSYSGSYYFPEVGEYDAREIVKAWRHRKIIVHYFPGNPARSVFIPEEQPRVAQTNQIESLRINGS